MFKRLIPISVSFFLFLSCSDKNEKTLFSLQNNKDLGVDFINQLEDRPGTNVFTFRNYYNGGGVAIGDVNNDGLNDVYLTSNQGDNQLLINKGNWQFENVAERAGVKGSKYWSTGVTMVDVNSDGWLDIYVCNSGNAQGGETENELFINQKNGTFKEEAKLYGLADGGLSTHAVFFDYDLDGDLDCYVLNNSFRPIGSFDFSKNLRLEEDKMGGDRLYKKEQGKYKEVNKEAGIYSSDIGFGLGVSVVDMNQDGYPDIYVSNDFFEHDYLYINQQNGTFKESIAKQTGHLSLASMGSDIADINNDGLYDIFTTEMLPEGDSRLKTMTSFESYDIVKSKERDGYHTQFMQNCLQLNNGDGTFSEIAFYAGVAATDWSWGALTFDMDNDGWKDIFVSNGIYKDLTNQDYIEFLANRDNMEKIAQGKKFDFKEFTDKMKSTPVSNYAFINNKNLTFSNKSEALGLDKESFSNGAAYGDLDNDGDNDLIVNNVNMPLFIYKNNAEKSDKNHYVQINLKGDSLNKNGLGSTIKTFNKNLSTTYYHQPARGFQSSIPPNLITIGVGNHQVIDSLHIIWPGGKFQTIKNLRSDSLYQISASNANQKFIYKNPATDQALFSQVDKQLFDSPPTHIEDDFIDFDQERLMLQMLSTENPYLASGDLNNDGMEDFYMSASKGQTAAIYLQQNSGRFVKYVPEEFEKQIYLENAGAVFGDFDLDGDEDLIVTFGGNQEPPGEKVLYPRFYENDGKGKLTRNNLKTIPISINASVIIKSDYDKDGDLDLFIGGRSIPGTYGSSPQSYVLENDGKGKFTDNSKKVLGDNKLGMVTDAKWVDLDKNGFEDLVVTGNWMGIKIYKNSKGKFIADTRLDQYKGWWSSLEVADVDGDGDLDIVGGNLGLNSKFKASVKEPMKIYVKDFDSNGTKECVTSIFKNDGNEYVFHLRQDLVGQLPSFKKRFLKYEDYAGKEFTDVFTSELTEGAEIHQINYLQSAIFINEGEKKPFVFTPFPKQAQFSTVNKIICDDLKADGTMDIILAGNFYGFKPEVGRLDASYGQVYQLKNKRFTYFSPKQSGLNLSGQVRSALIIKNAKGNKTFLFGRNNAPLAAYQINPTIQKKILAKGN